MKKMTIKINSLYDATELVRQATRSSGDINIYKGNLVVDAASLIGVLSLDMSDGVIIEYPQTAIALENYLKQFTIN